PQTIDLLSIDIDGQDYFIWNSLIKYRPLVVVCEYDPNADKGYIPPLGWMGGAEDLKQAGYQAISYVAAGKGYTVVAKTTTNIIAVRNELIPLLLEDSGGASTGAVTERPTIGDNGPAADRCQARWGERICQLPRAHGGSHWCGAASWPIGKML